MILSLIDRIIIPGARESEFDIKSSALLTLDAINEFVFENLRKPSKKRPDLAQKIKIFYNLNQLKFE